MRSVVFDIHFPWRKSAVCWGQSISQCKHSVLGRMLIFVFFFATSSSIIAFAENVSIAGAHLHKYIDNRWLMGWQWSVLRHCPTLMYIVLLYGVTPTSRFWHSSCTAIHIWIALPSTIINQTHLRCRKILPLPLPCQYPCPPPFQQYCCQFNYQRHQHLQAPAEGFRIFAHHSPLSLYQQGALGLEPIYSALFSAAVINLSNRSCLYEISFECEATATSQLA